MLCFSTMKVAKCSVLEKNSPKAATSTGSICSLSDGEDRPGHCLTWNNFQPDHRRARSEFLSNKELLRCRPSTLMCNVDFHKESHFEIKWKELENSVRNTVNVNKCPGENTMSAFHTTNQPMRMHHCYLILRENPMISRQLGNTKIYLINRLQKHFS